MSDKNACKPAAAELSEYLKSQYPGRPRATFLRRLLGPPDPTYEIVGVDEAPYSGLFRRHLLYWVRIRDSFLEIPCLPSSMTLGLFSHGDDGILEIRPALKQNLSRLLASEGTPLAQINALTFADLVCEATLRDRASSHAVLASLQDLEHPEQSTTLGPLYRVDPRELERVASRFEVPRIESLADGGWLLRFTSLDGWMHDKKRVSVSHIAFSRDYSVGRVQQDTLSTRMFASVPFVRY